MSKKIINFVKYGLLGAGVIGVAVGLPFAVASGKSYDLFAEIIVSDNTSVLADSSFSETTYEGFQTFVNKKEAKDILPKASSIPQSSGVWRRPGDTTFSRETTFRGLFASGKDMLIGPGFNHETAIRNVATNKDFANKGFLLLDSSINEVTNVSSFIFRADQSGFLTGVAACIFLNENSNIFNADGALRIGAFVGLPFPSTMDFLAGFQAGVFAWNASITPQNQKKEVEWISLGNTQGDYASNSFAVGGGVAKAQELLERGADVIMPIAGPQTADVVGEIIKQGKIAVVAGVDSAQELQTINKPLPGATRFKNGFQSSEHPNRDMIIQFSAVKLLDKATEGVLDAIFNKTDPNNADAIAKSPINGNIIGGFGFINTGTIENGTVGTSIAGINQLAVDVDFKSWVNTTDNTIVWTEVKKNTAFLDMTNNALFYTNGTGILTKKTGDMANGLTIHDKIFTKLPGGTATATPAAGADKVKLDGSKWSIVR